MDFDSHFIECCRACNSFSQNHQQTIGVQGQGDSRDNIRISEDQKIWKGAETGKKLKTKVKEKDKSLLKVDRPKKSENVQCDCLKKANKKDISDKLRQNTNKEKKTDIFENCDDSWNYTNIKWDGSSTERYCDSEEFRNTNQSDNKTLAETISKLTEKVDFLFRVFSNGDEKLTESDVEWETKSVGTVLKDAWNLCNFNRRLCIAEDGIEKLALILENLLKESNKKAAFIDETVTYNDPLNFEELPITQRINLLKSRNDMLLSFMKGFLKVGSVEEIYSQLAVLPEDYELKQVPLTSSSQYNDKNKLLDYNKEKVMETLRNLRMQLTQESERQPQNSDDHKPIKSAKREENPLKYTGKKLEVISEQAELSLYSDNDNENENYDVFKIKNTRNLKGKFSEVSEDLEETDLSLRDVTTRLFAQEAMLKSSLDKVHLELFSKEDLPEKNSTKANWESVNSPTRSEYPTKERDSKNRKENNFHSTREINCIYCENEIAEKAKFNDAVFYAMSDEYKEPVKEEKKYLESSSNNLSKHSTTVKKTEDHEETKKKPSRRLSHKNSYTLLATSKANRNNSHLSDGCSSSREESKTEVRGENPRPVTAPNFQNKTCLKSLTLEKTNKKNLGLKNIKNKNKILLSKKSFVQTS